MYNKRLIAKASLLGTAFGMITTIILTCILSILILSTGLLPEDITQYIMAIMLGFGGFVGGFISSKITKSAGLVVGLITGLIIFLVVTIVGLIKSTDSVSAITLVKLVLLLLFSGIGGIAGLHKRDKINI